VVVLLNHVKQDDGELHTKDGAFVASRSLRQSTTRYPPLCRLGLHTGRRGHRRPPRCAWCTTKAACNVSEPRVPPESWLHQFQALC
jgi:hypothetical protein